MRLATTARSLAVGMMLVGCGSPPSPATPAPVAEVAVAAVPTADGSPHAASPRPTSPPRRLRLVKNDHGDGSADCTVVDDATGAVVGRATSTNTAAGGSTIGCYDFVAGGKIIRFVSSRGIYAKDARPGAPDDGAVACGDGAFADDATSCVKLDASPFAYGGSEAAATAIPFQVTLCTTSGFVCTPLVTVPRGLNRIGVPGQPQVERWWDAKYCSDDRVLVVAEGVLRLFEAPSGKLLAEAPAPRAVRILQCEAGVARTSGRTPDDVLSFTVDRATLRP